MTRRMRPSSKAFMIAAFFFLYFPIAVLIFFSFNASEGQSLFTGFSLRWYERLFSDKVIFSALGNTLLVAAVSSVAATLIGTAASVGLSGMRKWQRTAIMNVTYVPVVNPEIVTGISMILLFTMLNSIFRWGNEYMGMGTLIIAHITFNIPYIIFSVSPKLRQMDKNMYDAALDLGCSPAKAFFKIVLPEIMPGVFTGFLMALTYSIDDFVISYFAAGLVKTLPIEIYSRVRVRVKPDINALSTLLFVIVLSILLLMNIKDMRSNKKTAKEKRL